MTEEYKLKKRAHDIYMRFLNLGIPHQKAQNAAITCVMALVDQYVKINKDTPEKQIEQRARFEKLINNINDYFAGRKYIEVTIEEIAALKGCNKDEVFINHYKERDYIQVNIDEIAKLKGCTKEQILIIY
jgi:S-adenosylmethionine synthetase